MIIVNPIPVQEEENAEFLESKGAAMWIKKEDKIEDVISSVLNNPDRLQQMKINAKLLAKKNSTKDICEILMKNL